MFRINNTASSINFKGRDGYVIYSGNTVTKVFYPGNQKEFKNEKDSLEFLSKAGYKNSPQFIEAGIKDGKCFIKMTRVEGKTLFDFLLKASAQQIKLVQEKIQEATIELARLNIMHMDLNRGNIIVSTDVSGNPKAITIIDYSEIKKVVTKDICQLADDMMFRKNLILILEHFAKQKI